MDELYKRIKSRREELGLTQEELAAKMGYRSRSSINKIELGKNDIPQAKVEAFARALDTSVAWLLGMSDDLDAPPDTHKELLAAYDVLNREGQRVALARVQEMGEIAKYRREK
jgi:repressor LexA